MNRKTEFLIMAVAGSSLDGAGQSIKPVVVNPDNSVTISASFPDADEVDVKGAFLSTPITLRNLFKVFRRTDKEEMTKDDSGIWTYTSKPLPSDMYTYNFEVDDADTFDIKNRCSVRDVNTWLNYFIIPGGIGDYFITQKVPHGKVSLEWYASSLPGVPRRRMAVYTPPYYSPSEKYPVLYLLHGSGGDERSWLELGREAQILDNLIARKECVPMIVVMPNGISNRAATPGEDPYNKTPASASPVESMLGLTESVFVPEVVRYVETHYSVIQEKRGRAIAGLSLGGLHTLFISANNPNEFDYVGLFSAQTTNKMTTKKKISAVERLAAKFNRLSESFSFITKGGKGKKLGTYANMVNEGRLSVYDSLDQKLARQFSNPPKLYYIAYGSDDFLKDVNEEYCQRLTKAGYKYTLNLTGGGHTWDNWRKYLIDFLRKLFRWDVAATGLPAGGDTVAADRGGVSRQGLSMANKNIRSL